MDTLPETSSPKVARGEKTMEQLLTAGIEAFAKQGPDGVTTRQLANMAGVNSAAIAYYFGGKEGFYIAVVKHLIDQHAKPVLTLFAQFSEALDNSDKTPETAGALLKKLISRFLVTILMDSESKHMAGITSREQLQPTSAFELIYKEIILPLNTTLSKIIGCVTQKSPYAPETIVRTHALLGEVIFFRISPISIHRRLNCHSMTEKRARFIADIVADMACRSLRISGEAETEKSF